MVSPKYYTQMHEVVSEITKITAEDLRYGFPFKIAFDHFKKWCGDEFAFITWGFDDVNMLKDNMLLHKMNTEWLPVTYNLQVIFDDQITKEHRQISLSAAMELVQEEALIAHDALNDAKNTACICKHLDMEKGLTEYEDARKQMRCIASAVNKPPKPEKYYASKKEALKDPELIRFYYPEFEEEIVCTGILEQNEIKFIAIGISKSGKELFVRFKFKRWGLKEYSVSRMVYEMDEKHYSYYWSRWNKKNERKVANYPKTKYYTAAARRAG